MQQFLLLKQPQDFPSVLPQAAGGQLTVIANADLQTILGTMQFQIARGKRFGEGGGRLVFSGGKRFQPHAIHQPIGIESVSGNLSIQAVRHEKTIFTGQRFHHAADNQRDWRLLAVKPNQAGVRRVVALLEEGLRDNNLQGIVRREQPGIVVAADKRGCDRIVRLNRAPDT